MYILEWTTDTTIKKVFCKKAVLKFNIKILETTCEGVQRNDKVVAIGLHYYYELNPSLIGFKGFNQELRPSKFTEQLFLKQLFWQNIFLISDTQDIETFQNNIILSLNTHYRLYEFCKGYLFNMNNRDSEQSKYSFHIPVISNDI